MQFHLQYSKDGGEKFSANSIHMHPRYNEAPTYLEYDVAILEIKGKSTKNIVKLNADNSFPSSQLQLTTLGWGALDVHGTIMANALQAVHLSYISNVDCNQFGIPIVKDYMMCAFDLDEDSIVEDSCYGDSGGPLLVSNSEDGIETQVGIVSFGSKKCGEFPGIYTRTSSTYSWIREKVCEVSIDPPSHFECDPKTDDPSTAPTIPVPIEGPSSIPSYSIEVEYDEGIRSFPTNSPIASNSPTRTTTTPPSLAPTMKSKHPKNERIVIPDLTHVEKVEAQEPNHDTSGAAFVCHNDRMGMTIMMMISLSIILGMGIYFI